MFHSHVHERCYGWTSNLGGPCDYRRDGPWVFSHYLPADLEILRNWKLPYMGTSRGLQLLNMQPRLPRQYSQPNCSLRESLYWVARFNLHLRLSLRVIALLIYHLRLKMWPQGPLIPTYTFLCPWSKWRQSRQVSRLVPNISKARRGKLS